MKKILLFVIFLTSVAVASAQHGEPKTVSSEVQILSQRTHRILARGYRGMVEMPAAVSLGSESGLLSMGLLSTHGFQFSPHVFVGAGVGVQYFANDLVFFGLDLDEDFVVMPLYGDVRLTLLKKWVTPYLDLKSGWSFGNEVSGVMLNPSVGVRFGFSRHFGLHTGVGYAYQGDVSLHCFSIHVGIDF